MFELSGGISWRFQRNFWETSACMTSWRNPVQNVSAQQSTSQRTKSFAMSLFSEICRVMPPALFINYAQDLIHTAKWLMSLWQDSMKERFYLLSILLTWMLAITCTLQFDKFDSPQSIDPDWTGTPPLPKHHELCRGRPMCLTCDCFVLPSMLGSDAAELWRL